MGMGHLPRSPDPRKRNVGHGQDGTVPGSLDPKIDEGRWVGGTGNDPLSSGVQSWIVSRLELSGSGKHWRWWDVLSYEYLVAVTNSTDITDFTTFPTFTTSTTSTTSSLQPPAASQLVR